MRAYCRLESLVFRWERWKWWRGSITHNLSLSSCYEESDAIFLVTHWHDWQRSFSACQRSECCPKRFLTGKAWHKWMMHNVFFFLFFLWKLALGYNHHMRAEERPQDRWCRELRSTADTIRHAFFQHHEGADAGRDCACGTERMEGFFSPPYNKKKVLELIQMYANPFLLSLFYRCSPDVAGCFLSLRPPWHPSTDFRATPCAASLDWTTTTSLL